MSGSMWMYFVLMISCVVFAKYAQANKQVGYMWLIVLFLTLIAGLRSVNVGIDTVSYTKMFNMLAEGYSDAWFGAERSFLALIRSLQYFSESPTFLFLLFSFITNVLIVFRIWEFREEISLPWAIFYFYACYYFFTFNIVRQMVAVAVVFWGTRYVQKEKYIRYLLVLAVACVFHQSALLGLLYLAADIIWKNKWNWKEKIRKRRIFLIPILCAVALGAAFVLIKASKYLHYFTNVTINIGVLVPMKLAFLAAFIVMVKYTSGKWGGREESALPSYINKNVVSYYGFGLFLSLCGYFYPFMDRIGLYFAIFGCLFVGYVRKKTKNPWLVYTVFTVLLILPFLKDLFAGGQGQLPYEFFWQQ